MARIELRLSNGYQLEELPPVCMYCGRDVDEFTRFTVPVGNRRLALSVPLCRRDSEDGIQDLVTAAGRRLMAQSTPLGMAVGAAVLASRDDAVTIPVDGVDREFVRELMRLRERQAREFERNLSSGALEKDKKPREPANEAFVGLEDDSDPKSADARRRRLRRGVPGWVIILVGVLALLAIGVALLIVLSGSRRSSRLRRSEANPAIMARMQGSESGPRGSVAFVRRATLSTLCWAGDELA